MSFIDEELCCKSITCSKENSDEIKDLMKIIREKFTEEDLHNDHLEVIDLAIKKLDEKWLGDSQVQERNQS
jgi:hypothetical protein